MSKAAITTITTINMISNIALLRLMHLVSPALPVGAYAYSQGLEAAVDNQWLTTTDDIYGWIAGVLNDSLVPLDLAVFLRLYAACESGDIEQQNYWNAYILAARETEELLLEDEQLGIALQRLLVSLHPEQTAIANSNRPSFAYMFANAAYLSGIPVSEASLGFAWSWLENQVAAATKIVPLGQTQAQHLLVRLQPDVERAVLRAGQVVDSMVGSGLPALSMASSMHERQYSRLFRS